ncbi:MAG: hypothetical protein M3Q24_00450 [bacterium]|nr:hypothetical protein [bacterium]
MKENLESNLPESVDKYRVLTELVEDIEAVSESKDLNMGEKTERLKELVEDLLDHISDDLELDLSSEVSDIYNEMSQRNLLARVESVKNVVECLSVKKPIKVGDKDHHYANCVTSDKEGLRIAMAEAEAIGPVRLLMGLDLKALIGFSNDHIEVAGIEDNEFDLRDTTLRKVHCRHIVGQIYAEDIKYLVLRIPKHFFPESKLLDDEKMSLGKFIFRGARVETFEAQQSDLEIAA